MMMNKINETLGKSTNPLIPLIYIWLHYNDFQIWNMIKDCICGLFWKIWLLKIYNFNFTQMNKMTSCTFC